MLKNNNIDIGGCFKLTDLKLGENILYGTIDNNRPRQIENGEWIYKGCFIQESKHPKLEGNYEVFKNNKEQSHVGRCYTFDEAKKLCEENECFDNFFYFLGWEEKNNSKKIRFF